MVELFQFSHELLQRSVKKTVRISVSKVSQLGAGFLPYQVHSEAKLGHHSEIRNQRPCDTECKDYCLIGNCSHLVGEDIVGCL